MVFREGTTYGFCYFIIVLSNKKCTISVTACIEENEGKCNAAILLNYCEVRFAETWAIIRILFKLLKAVKVKYLTELS